MCIRDRNNTCLQNSHKELITTTKVTSMSKDEIKDKKRKVEDGELIEKKKKHKKDKKDKSEKKDKKDKKDKKSKKEKKDKKQEVKESARPTLTSSVPVSTGKYTQSEELSSVPQSEIDSFFKENEVTVKDPTNLNLRPLLSFEHISLTSEIQQEISKFPKPTPIQSVSWPYLLAGKDVIGVAETGSGKTFAFGVPAINNIVTSSEGRKTKNVQVLVVSPTRELASQTYDNLVLLTDKVGLQSCCVYGGVPKDEQRYQLKRSQVVVATPGRLLDLIQEGSVDLSHVNYLVLDEADRMLEKGFEEDIKLSLIHI